MEPILDPEIFSAADLLIVAEAITNHVNNVGDFTHYTDVPAPAEPITDQDLASTMFTPETQTSQHRVRLLERVAWCNRAHESIQWHGESTWETNRLDNHAEALASALDLQSLALDSIIHWTQVEYYR